jgi:hypothetical protein
VRPAYPAADKKPAKGGAVGGRGIDFISRFLQLGKPVFAGFWVLE